LHQYFTGFNPVAFFYGDAFNDAAGWRLHGLAVAGTITEPGEATPLSKGANAAQGEKTKQAKPHHQTSMRVKRRSSCGISSEYESCGSPMCVDIPTPSTAGGAFARPASSRLN
jgi:hypothetical protein